MLEHIIIQFSLYSLSNGCLQEIKNKIKFQTFSFKSGRGHLLEILNMVVSLRNVWYFGCWGEVVTHDRWLQLEVQLYLNFD